MKFLDDGNVDYSVNDFIHMMKSGIDINNLYSSDNKYLADFNKNLKIFEQIQFTFDKKNINHTLNQQNWFIPEEYNTINIDEYLLNLCKTDIEKNRIIYELDIFKKYNLESLLKFIIFLVDLMRELNCVWGVGRGSSVCSYSLYLIGIHKINSIKYDLDFNEFLE